MTILITILLVILLYLFWINNNIFILLATILLVIVIVGYIITLHAYFKQFIILDAEILTFDSGNQVKSIPIDTIDEFFYIVYLDKTKIRTVEQPRQYQIITGNDRYKIDLEVYVNEDIIEANEKLKSKLGHNFTVEERYTRDTTMTSKDDFDDKFIELDTV